MQHRKGYGPADMGVRLLVDVIGKESIRLKPVVLSFCVFVSFSIHRLDKRGGQKKRAIYCINLSKGTGCLSGQLYIRVLEFP